MKTNLLKLAAGLCFALGVVNSANAQITIAKEDFDYPVGDLSGTNGGTGWLGAWDANNTTTAPGNPTQGQVVAGNFNGNTVGNSAAISGGWSDGRFREFAVPFANVAGENFWMRFNYQIQGSLTQYSGMSFFNLNSENGYFGQVDNQLFGTGSSWPDSTFTGVSGNQTGIVSCLDPHNYLLHVVFKGNDVMKVDVWADYLAVATPMADFAEPTYQYTAWFNSSGGITQIRLAGSLDQGVVAYDGIKLTDIYTQAPFALEDGIAKSTAKESNASFYPNPVTNGELNVVAAKESLKSVSIFDLSGKKVASKSVEGKSTKINTQGLAKGVYILEVSGSKSTSRNKLVID